MEGRSGRLCPPLRPLYRLVCQPAVLRLQLVGRKAPSDLLGWDGKINHLELADQRRGVVHRAVIDHAAVLNSVNGDCLDLQWIARSRDPTQFTLVPPHPPQACHEQIAFGNLVLDDVLSGCTFVVSTNRCTRQRVRKSQPSPSIIPPMPETIRVLLVDDHPVLRQGTAQLLDAETGLSVVGEAGDGQEALDLVESLAPDVIVMDIRMPRMSGIEATRHLRQHSPQARVLILTAHDDDEYVFSLLQAGASGYLLKSAPVDQLIQAIREVNEGQMPLDPAIRNKLVLQLSSEDSAPDTEPPSGAQLTPREFEVLRLLARGLSNRSIGLELTISNRTVQAHLTNIFSKMNVGSRVEAVLEAIRRGWLTIEA